MKKISLLLISTLLISSCQKTEVSDKFMTTDEMLNALYSDDDIKKLCSINTKAAQENFKSMVYTTPPPLNVPGQPPLIYNPETLTKTHKSLNEFYSDFMKSLGLPVIGGGDYLQSEGPYASGQTEFKKAEFQVGDMIYFAQPIYDAAYQPNVAEIGAELLGNLVKGTVGDIMSAISSGMSIYEETSGNKPRSDTPDPSSLASYGIQGFEGHFIGIIEDPRLAQDPVMELGVHKKDENGNKMYTENWHATVVYGDFKYDKSNKVQSVKVRPLSGAIFQKNAIIVGTAIINKPQTNEFEQFSGMWGHIRNPVMSWVKDSGVCENCTKTEFCSHEWQNCMNNKNLKGYNTLKDMLDNHQCEKDRCGNSLFNCKEKKYCLMRYGHDRKAAEAMVCPEDEDKGQSYCERYPQQCLPADPEPTPGGEGDGIGGGDQSNPFQGVSGGDTSFCGAKCIGVQDFFGNPKQGDLVKAYYHCEMECGGVGVGSYDYEKYEPYDSAP